MLSRQRNVLTVVLSTLLLFALSVPAIGKMIEVYKWKQLEFFSCANNSNNNNNVGRQRSLNNFTAPNRNLMTNYDSNELRRDHVIHFPKDDVNDPQRTMYGRDYSRESLSVNRVSTSTTTTTSSPASSSAESRQDFPCNLYNSVPMGATHYGRRLFISVPRRSEGVPSTLNYVNLGEQTEISPKLRAYPNFEINQFQDKRNGLVSVYRTTVDKCGRLWFVDTGVLEYTNTIKIQQPSIWIIDLETDRVIRRITIPEDTTDDGQGLPSITVDTDKGCNLAYAYFPDIYKRYLHVYSFEMDRFWSFQHNYFSFDPLASELYVGGLSFSWDDGIFSITMGPQQNDGSRLVFFHAMISNDEFGVSNYILQDPNRADRSYHGKDFHLLGHRGPKRQSTMHSYDNRTNVVFYAEIQRNGIGCWNADRPLTPEYHGTVASDPERMVYPSDLTIDSDGFLWVITNNMPVFAYSKLDTNAYNFRIWKQQTSEAVKGTVCEK